MATRKPLRPHQRAVATAARGVSWISLLAAATLGVSGVDQVHAHISGGEGLLADGELRLIVQSYRKDTLEEGRLPQSYAQPLASIQRAVTAEELRQGVDVSFLQLPADEGDADSVVVAWVEQGLPNLDLDAMEARPNDRAYYGVARRTDGEIVLRRSEG